MKAANLLHPLPPPGPEEHFEDLLSRPGCRIERIVSHGQQSPQDSWYDQDEDEWVLVVSGGASLEFADPAETVALCPGDHVLIPAHRKHRVAQTESPTVWLAVWMPVA